MKKFSKIAAVVALMLVVCLSFTGCGNLGNAIISALSLDVTVDDPALIKVEDILDKTVKTESVKSGDFTYTLYTDNTACITGYTGSNPVVSIPAEIDGTKVIGLENKALKSSSTLKELILPDSVEAIGNYAAMYCDSLEKVTIGKNIKHIGISAFDETESVEPESGTFGWEESASEELEIVVGTDGKLVKVEKEADEKKDEKDEKEGTDSSHMKKEKHESHEKREHRESQETNG